MVYSFFSWFFIFKWKLQLLKWTHHIMIYIKELLQLLLNLCGETMIQNWAFLLVMWLPQRGFLFLLQHSMSFVNRPAAQQIPDLQYIADIAKKHSLIFTYMEISKYFYALPSIMKHIWWEIFPLNMGKSAFNCCFPSSSPYCASLVFYPGLPGQIP